MRTPPLITSLLPTFLPLAAQIGVPRDGLPNWYERTIYLNVNAARMDPPAFGATFGKAPNPLTTYSIRTPYILHHNLNRAARYHSEDMMSCNRMSHTSCDGTTFAARLRNFTGTTGAECIARSYRTPLEAVDAWLHSDAGHRDALMHTRYTDIGCGHALGSTNWWTVDLASLSPAQTHPVYGGSHQIITTGTTDFWLNHYTAGNQAPRSVTLILDHQRVPMTRILGTDSRGTYGAKSPAASVCRSYYFEIITADGALRRYPESGMFRTFGEGSCREDFTAATKSPASTPEFVYRPLILEKTGRVVWINHSGTDHIARMVIVSPDGRRVWGVDGAKISPHPEGVRLRLPDLPPAVYLVVVHRTSGGAVSARITVGQ